MIWRLGALCVAALVAMALLGITSSLFTWQGDLWHHLAATQLSDIVANTIVLLLGVEDVKVSKQFYLDHGLEVTRSFGRKYVEFATGPNVKLALYGRRALAKDAGVSPDGTGAHRIVISGDAEPFTDPDGFTWQTV